MILAWIQPDLNSVFVLTNAPNTSCFLARHLSSYRQTQIIVSLYITSTPSHSAFSTPWTPRIWFRTHFHRSLLPNFSTPSRPQTLHERPPGQMRSLLPLPPFFPLPPPFRPRLAP